MWMSERRLRGLSLLEVQVALLLLLLVSLYLMSLFASGQRHARRALDYSRATLLAHRRLEEARAVPVPDLRPGLTQESEPYQGFNTTLSVAPYEGGLSLLAVDTRAPSGALARAFTLVPDWSRFHGVAADVFAHQIAWTNGPDLMVWDDLTGTATNLGPVGDGRKNGALSGQPGSNQIWRGGVDLGPIPFLERVPTPDTWGAALSSPVVAPDNWISEVRFTGLASDGAGDGLVAADISNSGLWFSRSGSWTGSQVTRPKEPPLGRPGGVACDPAMSLIWVADQDYQCLRKLVCPAAAAAYPAAQLESAGALGSWHRNRFRPPPALGMGSPAGLAMDPLGWAVYVHDRARLYRYLDGPQTWELLGTLPLALVQEIPSGLATDRYGSQIYLATEQGSLWKVKATTSLTDADFRKLWP